MDYLIGHDYNPDSKSGSISYPPPPASMVFSMMLGLLYLIPIALADPSEYTSSDGVIYVDNGIIKEVIEKYRDCALVMLINTQFCDKLASGFRLLAINWIRDHPYGDGLYFVNVNIENVQDTFKDLGLSDIR